jgi:hypothetical protein
VTWLLLRNPSGSTAIEHHALVRPTDQVISRHASYPEACAALVKYRERIEREELEAAGQMGLDFGGAP